MTKKFWIVKVMIVALLSFALTAPAFADATKEKKVEKKSFSIMKKIDKKEAKALDTKEMKKIKGGNVHLNIQLWKNGIKFNSAKEAVFAYFGKSL